MDKHEALKRLAAIEVETAKLRKIIDAAAPRLAWIGKWGFYSDGDPECPDDGAMGRLEGIDPGCEYGNFAVGGVHWSYFRPATPEELGVTAAIEPDWSKAPEWAQYWAVDADGAQYWYENKPDCDDDACRWYGMGGKISGSPCLSWRDTLRERPEAME